MAALPLLPSAPLGVDAAQADWRLQPAALQRLAPPLLLTAMEAVHAKFLALRRARPAADGRCGGAGPSHGAPQAPPYTELPVALVHAGCNMADHALTMRQLLHHLRRECSTHLAVLRSKKKPERGSAPLPLAMTAVHQNCSSTRASLIVLIMVMRQHRRHRPVRLVLNLPV